jgi:hypothetical protein
MEPLNEEPPWVFGLGAIVFIVGGVVMLFVAYHAAQHATIIQGTYRTAWMSPLQAYLAGGVCVLFGILFGVLWLRRGERK